MSTSLSPTDLKFGTADGKLWTRRLYGQEAQAAYFVWVSIAFWISDPDTLNSVTMVRVSPCMPEP